MKKRQTIIADIKKMGFEAFHHEGEKDIVSVSAENLDGAADYWGEFYGEDLWINPKLETYAAKMDCFWEWENPGCIKMYKVFGTYSE